MAPSGSLCTTTEVAVENLGQLPVSLHLALFSCLSYHCAMTGRFDAGSNGKLKG